MKKVYIVAIVFALLMLPISAIADGYGKALIPWSKGYSNSIVTNIYITNISNSSVNVTVTLFDSSGDNYDESTEGGDNVIYGYGFASDPVNATSGVSLASKKTGSVNLMYGTGESGYALIEWESTDDLYGAVIAYGLLTDSNSGRQIIEVNNSQPF